MATLTSIRNSLILQVLAGSNNPLALADIVKRVERKWPVGNNRNGLNHSVRSHLYAMTNNGNVKKVYAGEHIMEYTLPGRSTRSRASAPVIENPASMRDFALCLRPMSHGIYSQAHHVRTPSVAWQKTPPWWSPTTTTDSPRRDAMWSRGRGL